MNNLIEFLNYKHNIINLKLKDKKIQLKSLKQSGGAELQNQLSQLEDEIVKLVAINKILSNQKEKVSGLNLDGILDNLTSVTSKFNELIKQAPTDFEIRDSLYTNRILNLMQSLETQLDGSGTDFLNIRLNNKLTFVQPPIDIMSIDRMSVEFVNKLEENIQRFITTYTVKSSESEKTFATEKTDLQLQSRELSEKITSLEGFKKQIIDRLQEIKTYTVINYKPEQLNSAHFFEPSDANPQSIIETITVNQLSGLDFGPSGSVDVAITNISKLGDLQDIDQLIKPSFSTGTGSSIGPRTLHQQGGFNNFSLFSTQNKKESKVINSLITKWDNELYKAKSKLCKKHYLISTINSKHSNTTNTANLLNKQSGGAFKNWEEYYTELISYQQKVGEYKTLFNDLVQVANEFNLAYLQFFYHKLFIVNYVKFTLTKPSYRVYHNISRGSVSYYHSIVSNILTKLANPSILKTNSSYNYFYTYHLLNLQILDKFLTFLHKNWKPAPDKEDLESNKNISRLHILNSRNPHSPEITKGFFLFNLFKDILDDFKLTQSSPISVFLRINDRVELPSSTPNTKEVNFIKSETSKEQLQLNQLEQCLTRTGQITNKADILRQFGSSGGIKFNEIFDSEGFKNNDTLALYMGIPNYLSKSQSIMMITYGYSGVGKTYTLFGNTTQPGVLQKALTSIQDMKAIYTRSYEIYGLALPYKSYWSGRDPSEYAHQIYTYRIKSSGDIIDVEHTLSDIKSGSDIKAYLDDVKSDIDDDNTGSYSKIDTIEITNFSDFVEKIDNIRIAEGRIKKTINNPVSSRSIMVYEFKVKLNSDKVVRLVVMDLPGKEDILNSYVKPSADIQEQYCIQLKNKPWITQYNQTALRAAIYLNPILLATFPLIAVRLNQFITEKLRGNKEYLSYPVTTVGKDNLSASRTIGTLISWVNVSTSSTTQTFVELKRELKGLIDEHIIGKVTVNLLPYNRDTRNQYDRTIATAEEAYLFYKYLVDKRQVLSNATIEEKYISAFGGIKSDYDNPTDKSNFKQCMLAGENLRFILEKNRIDILLEFYSQFLIQENTGTVEPGKPDCNKNKNPAALSFEGFYINENILGLINTLNTRLNRDCPDKLSNPIPSMGNYFSIIMKEKDTSAKIINVIDRLIFDKIVEYSKKIEKEELINLIKLEIKKGNIKPNNIKTYYESNKSNPSFIIDESTLSLEPNHTLYDLEYTYTFNGQTKRFEDPGNETRSQTYFLRDFLREPLQVATTPKFFNGSNILLNASNQAYDDSNSKFLDMPIKSWFESTYDFNKTYADEPPIATFMEAYFGKEADGITDVINNFYLFYVVSNDNKDKCANQIKLISDSEIFIKTIKEWTPCA